jgi:hypothetical protein
MAAENEDRHGPLRPGFNDEEPAQVPAPMKPAPVVVGKPADHSHPTEIDRDQMRPEAQPVGYPSGQAKVTPTEPPGPIHSEPLAKPQAGSLAKDYEPTHGPKAEPQHQPEKPAAKPEAKDEPKKAEPKAGAKHERQTAVEIEHITDAFGVVTVHGRVGDKSVEVKFRREDLLAIEDPQARVHYVAGQIASVAAREHDPVEIPNGLDMRGTHKVPS